GQRAGGDAGVAGSVGGRGRDVMGTVGQSAGRDAVAATGGDATAHFGPVAENGNGAAGFRRAGEGRRVDIGDVVACHATVGAGIERGRGGGVGRQRVNDHRAGGLLSRVA